MQISLHMKVMTSRERVMAAFEHKEADRIPMWCGASPEFLEKAKRELFLETNEEVYKLFGDDFRRVSTRYIGPDEFAPDKNLPPGATYKSPFGVPRHGYAYGMPIYHPLENATFEEIKAYPWPNPNWISAKNIKEDVKKWLGSYAILGGDWSPFFHDAIDLLGMERLLMGMYLEPETIEYVIEQITDYYYAVNKMILEEASEVIDILFIGNDFGTQNGPLFNNDLFVRFFGKHIERLATLAKSYGLKVMLHSCGSIESIIHILAELGVDALQALQPDAKNMEASHLKQTYGHEMVFNGCIDSHNILINGTKEAVICYTKQIIDIMKPNGGFILSPSHDFLLEETPVDNVLSMYQTGMSYGAY